MAESLRSYPVDLRPDVANRFIADDSVTSTIRRHREEQFDRIITAHGAGLSRVAASYAASPQEREDLTQEIALAIWRALPNFRGDSSERTFVFRIAHNRGLSLVSRRRTELSSEPIEIADPGPDPEARAEQMQRRERLLAAIRSLPVGFRQVLTLALEGLPHAEIGEVLGIAENNVAVRLSRARSALRAVLGGER